jgi:hypothetical protein
MSMVWLYSPLTAAGAIGWTGFATTSIVFLKPDYADTLGS